jgi:hypothetical protein
MADIFVISAKGAAKPDLDVWRANVSRMKDYKSHAHLRELGNPYPADKNNPGSTLDAYKRWLWKAMKTDTAQRRALFEIILHVRRGKKIELVCWCDDPTKCHASIVKAAVEYLEQK